MMDFKRMPLVLVLRFNFLSLSEGIKTNIYCTIQPDFIRIR